MRRLTRRRKAFIRAFVRLGGVGTKAAIAAGYSRRHADAAAYKLLANGIVLRRIVARIYRGAPGGEAALKRLLMPCRSAAFRQRVLGMLYVLKSSSP